MPLKPPVELSRRKPEHALVRIVAVVHIVVLDDDHLHVRQRRIVGGRTYTMAELTFAHATFPVLLLAGKRF